jgi:regulator of sigma E protease
MEAGDFDEPNGFHRKAAWQRILILAAGPASNFLMAIVLVTGLNLTQLNSEPGKVVSVVTGTPAARTGFVVGDRVTTVNGKPLTPGYIRSVEDAAPGMPLTIAGVHANGTPFSYVIEPSCDPKNQCLIGLGVSRVVTAQSAIVDGVSFPYNATTQIVTGLWSLVTGQVPGGVLGPEGFTGPIGIGAVTVGAIGQGPQTYIFLVALLSVALGFTNLLPFLALDGGRVVVVLLEVLRRRPFDRTSELNFQRIGLVALLGLAALISYLDIQRIASGQFPGLH